MVNVQFVIIGGSLGGLFAALALQKQGLNAQIYERNPSPLEGRGAGIVTHPQLHAFLEELGIGTKKLGVQLYKRRLIDKLNAIEAEIDFPQTLTAWGTLYTLLRANLKPNTYHLGKQFTHFNENNASITAYFADGTQVEAEGLIAADGFRSSLQHTLFNETLNYAGYVAWRGLCNENRLSKSTQEVLFDYFSFCLPAHEQMLGYPVAGENGLLEKGKRRYNYVWYRGASEAQLTDMLTCDKGKFHPVSIPPPLVQKHFLDELQRAAQDNLSPAFAEVVQNCDNFFQPIYDLSVPRMAKGRVVVLGDAAFVVRPHVGAGVTKAALDAKTLAQNCIEPNSIQDNFENFSKIRTLEGQKMIEKARYLGDYMAQKGSITRSSQDILTQTACLKFLL